MTWPARSLRILSILPLLLPVVASAEARPGWQRMEIAGTGVYARRYVPESLDQTQPAPLIVFLHGSGGRPEIYEPFLVDAADQMGVALVLTKSMSHIGWGFTGDFESVAESIRLAGLDLELDPARIAIAGHSSGGAYAYLLAYLEDTRFSAVFSMSAPFRPVSGLATDDYKAPIRMYYGTEDPNYIGGSNVRLGAQWSALGIPWEQEIQRGYGHSSWPDSTMLDGFSFLLRERYPVVQPPPPPPDQKCTPGDTVLCLHGRFSVSMRWRDFADNRGVGHAVPFGGEASGVFWFFGPQNLEVLVKIVKGCGFNGHYWVYAAATTDVEYTLEVVDLEFGTSVRYDNPLGVASPAITDIEAFPNCQ